MMGLVSRLTLSAGLGWASLVPSKSLGYHEHVLALYRFESDTVEYRCLWALDMKIITDGIQDKGGPMQVADRTHYSGRRATPELLACLLALVGAFAFCSLVYSTVQPTCSPVVIGKTQTSRLLSPVLRDDVPGGPKSKSGSSTIGRRTGRQRGRQCWCWCCTRTAYTASKHSSVPD